MKTKDSTRMDWLEKFGAGIDICSTQSHVWFFAGAGTVHFYANSYREAIDSAMAEYPLIP